MTIKNLWSLNVDEVITAQKIKSELGKEYEVFFPINSQLKDIDLLLQHPRTGKSKSVQVKGSRTYSPKESEIEHLGWGYDVRTSWNQVKDASIFSPTNKIDFFIFVRHEEELSVRKRRIKQDYLVIPIKDFRKITKNKKKKRKTGYYHYVFVVQGKKAVDILNTKLGKPIDLSKYLNNFDLLK